MANHAGGWPSGALMRFGSLDYIITMEGGLEQVRVPIQPTRAANLDPVVEAFEGLRLRAPEDRTSESSWFPDFDYKRLGCQLHAFLGPRVTQEDLLQGFFLLANITVELSGGELLSQKIMVGSALTVFPFGLHTVAEDVHCLISTSVRSPRTTKDHGLGLLQGCGCAPRRTAPPRAAGSPISITRGWGPSSTPS
jgi:hypothetical protein